MPVGGPRPVTLLHTSDVHLADPGGPEERALEAAVELANAAGVDAVLVAGDLFDHARVPEETLERAARLLNRVDRPVVLLHGNHDSCHERSAHARFDVARRCPDVKVLSDPDGSTVTLPDAGLVVWGRAMVEHEPGFRPLAGVPDRVDGAWCVVAGHGMAGPPSLVEGRSSPIPASDLDLDWDYVALGHIHEHRIVQEAPVTACYSGATAASQRSRPGVVLVDLVPGRRAAVRWTALPVPPDANRSQ